MRTRVKNQTNIFEDNLRLYEKLKNTKPRIPTKNQLNNNYSKHHKIKQRISQYDIIVNDKPNSIDFD